MITANWSEAAALFDAVVDLDETGRRAYLEAACDGKASLRADVEAMLAADADASGILSGPILGHRFPYFPDLQPGDRLGPYEVVRFIGRGGMGAVYLGKRIKDFDRTVAIKIIGRLIPDRTTFRRFLRERQILSSLDHPNIARLYDGGVTDAGVPYIVMEYIEGTPIDKYCEHHALSITARLELFREVCGAVAYAHRHLVVHRDLKPGNILVNADGVVKLLDFGIAKRIDFEQDITRLTTTDKVVATPLYACPEQLAGENLSTSWDVFALGKVLNEILFKNTQIDELRRDLESLSLRDRLRQRESFHDLACVVRKATDEREEYRYSSVGELVLDIGSILGGEVVSARSLSGPARFFSIARRRFSSIVKLTAVLSAVVLTVLVIAKERGEAANRALVASGLSAYLVSVMRVVDPDVRSARTLSAQEVLDEGTRQARANLPMDSPEYVQIIREIGSLYLKIGAFQQAHNLLTEVIASSAFSDAEFLAATHLELGKVLHIKGSNKDAEVHLRRSVRILDAPTTGNAALFSDVLEELAAVAIDQNLLPSADSLANACFEIRRRWLGQGAPRYADAIRLRARVRWRARDYEKAEELYLEALSAAKQVSGFSSLQVASILNDLGLVYTDLAQYDRADLLLSESLQIKDSVLGVNHPSFATSLANLAPVISTKFGPDSAESLMRRVIAIFVGNFGINHYEVATAKNNLALYLHETGRLLEAEQEYKGALEIWKNAVGVVHPDYLLGCHNLAIVLRDQRKFRDAIELYSESVRGFKQLGKNYRTSLAAALNGLGKSMSGVGDYAGAAASFRESLLIRQEEFPAGHWRIGTAMSLLGETLALLGEYEEATLMLREGYEVLKAARGPDDEKTREAEERLRRMNAPIIASTG